MIYVVVIVFLVFLDQLTKYLVFTNLVYNDPLPVIEGFFDLNLVFNTGAAWSIFSDQKILLFLVSLVGSIVFIFIFRRIYKTMKNTALNIGLAMMISGAIGNGIDRLFYGLDSLYGGKWEWLTENFNTNGVVDFLEFHIDFFGSRFPTFNFADCCLTVGVIIAIIGYLFLVKNEKEEKKEMSDENDN